jgi:putative hydrolase
MGQQWKAIAKIQAAMSLLEGFSNLMMDEIGARELPHFGVLEAAYRRRLLNRTPLERALLRLTGMEMKMQQYIQGERFVRAVRDQGGMALLAQVWRGPEWLPTMQEIQHSELWVARAGAAAA